MRRCRSKSSSFFFFKITSLAPISDTNTKLLILLLNKNTEKIDTVKPLHNGPLLSGYPLYNGPLSSGYPLYNCPLLSINPLYNGPLSSGYSLYHGPLLSSHPLYHGPLLIICLLSKDSFFSQFRIQPSKGK